MGVCVCVGPCAFCVWACVYVCVFLCAVGVGVGVGVRTLVAAVVVGELGYAKSRAGTFVCLHAHTNTHTHTHTGIEELGSYRVCCVLEFDCVALGGVDGAGGDQKGKLQVANGNPGCGFVGGGGGTCGHENSSQEDWS